MLKYFSLKEPILKILLSLSILLSLNLYADVSGPAVNIEQTKDSVTISYTAMGTNTCFNLKPARLLVSSMFVKSFGVSNIEVEFLDSSDPQAMCGAAMTRSTGTLVLERGDSLPKIADGRYRLLVNGEEQMIEIK
jgi:hypothetical protein